MQIVIVGAGAVGSYLAERFSLEGQDVVVIESDPARAAQVQAALDCLVITGNGASAATIEQAGSGATDLLVAVSSSDAVNVLACNSATKLGIPHTVARVEDPGLKPEVEALGVDLVIDPDEAAARDLLRLVGTGHVAELVEFADGQLVLVGAYVDADSPIVGVTLAELRQGVEGWNWLVLAIVRGGETSIARGDSTLQPGDHVILMATAESTREPFRLLGLSDRPADKVVILGATRLAQVTAALLARHGHRTTLVDEDQDRCVLLAESLPDTVVVCADPADPRVLEEIGIDDRDAVLALTGWDDRNVLGCLVARALGAGEVIARFTNIDLVGVLGGSGIDAMISPRLSAANEILRFVRRGVVYSAVTIPGSDAEVLELAVGPESPALGRTLAEMSLPKSVVIGGVERDGESFVPRGATRIEEGDRLIVAALPEGIRLAEELSG